MHTLLKTGGQTPTSCFNFNGCFCGGKGSSPLQKEQQKQRKKQQHNIHRKKTSKAASVQTFLQNSSNLWCGTSVYAKDPVPNLDMVHKRGDALKRILKITPN